MAHLLGLIILLAFAAACIVLVGTVALIHRLSRPQRQTYASALARKLPTDPADLELTRVEQQVTFPDGSTTPVWIIDGDAPAAPAMIIAHGWGHSRYAALKRAELFKTRASKLVVYDLRAHGESTAARSGLGAIEADDLIELLRQLDLPERLVLYGYSIGGSIAMAAAARAPGELRCRIKAVIADGPFRLPLEPISAARRRRRYPVFPFVHLAWGYAALRLRRYRPFDRVEDAARLPCPLLVLHGTEDWRCPFESARKIAAAAPRGEFIAFQGRGLLALSKHERAEYLQAISRLLDDVDGESDRHTSEHV